MEGVAQCIPGGEELCTSMRRRCSGIIKNIGYRVLDVIGCTTINYLMLEQFIFI